MSNPGIPEPPFATADNLKKQGHRLLRLLCLGADREVELAVPRPLPNYVEVLNQTAGSHPQLPVCVIFHTDGMGDANQTDVIRSDDPPHTLIGVSPLDAKLREQARVLYNTHPELWLSITPNTWWTKSHVMLHSAPPRCMEKSSNEKQRVFRTGVIWGNHELQMTARKQSYKSSCRA